MEEHTIKKGKGAAERQTGLMSQQNRHSGGFSVERKGLTGTILHVKTFIDQNFARFAARQGGF